MATVLLTTTSGTAWAEDGFWSGCVQDDMTFRDLRGTAVTRLAQAGSEVPEIATITGHLLPIAIRFNLVDEGRSLLTPWP
jgi:hypothetical protein